MRRCSLGIVLLAFSFLTVHFIPAKVFDFCPQISSPFSSQVAYADTDLSERDQEKIKEYYKSARQYYKEGNYGRTLTECQKIVEIDTYNINAHNLIKRARERLKKEETKKLEEKKRARERAEKEAKKQEKLKKKEEAKELARQQKAQEQAALEAKRQAEREREALKRAKQEKLAGLLSAVKSLYSDERYDAAIAQCREILRIDSDNRSAQKLIVKSQERIQIAKERELADKEKRAEQARLEAQKQAEKESKLKEEAQIRLLKQREKALKEQRRKEERIEKEAQKQEKLKKKEEAKELARQQKAQEQAALEAKRQAKRDIGLKEAALKEQRRREEQIEGQAKKQKQKKLDELFDVANGLYSDRKYDAAIAQCREILRIDSDNRSAQKLIVKSQERIQIAKERELADKEKRAEQARLEAQKQAEKESKLKEEAQIRLLKQREKALEEQRRKEARIEKEAQKQTKLKKNQEERELTRQRKAEAKAQVAREEELAEKEKRAEKARLEAQKQAKLRKKEEAKELAKQKEAEEKSAAETSKLAKQKAKEDAKKEAALIALQKKKIEERRQKEKEELENKIETHYRDGKKLYRNDEYSDAIKEFNAVLSLDSAHEGAKEYLEASEESLKEQNKRESVRQAKAAKKQIARKERLRKRDIQDKITDAKIKLDAGEHDKAIKILEEILPGILDENLRGSVELLISKTRTEKTVKEEKLTRKRLQAISDERMLEVTKAQLSPAEVRRIKELERKKEKVDAAIELRDKASSIKVPLVKYTGTDLRDVILFLIKQTGINIVVDEAMFSGEAAAPAAEQAEGWGGETAAVAQPTGPINTKVTCFLQNMTLLSVLEAILRPKGLDYKFAKEYIYVSTKARILSQPLEDMEIRVYSLEYGASMNIVRLTESGFKGGEREDREIGLGEGAEEGGAVEVRGESIKELLEVLVPQPMGASITVQSELNKLFVKNTPENLDKTEKILAELRTPVQVSIEARYVYVRLQEGEEIGFGFTDIDKSWRMGRLDNETHTIDSATILSGITGLGTTGINLTYTAILNRLQFTSVLRALQSRTDTNTLSAPMLTVLNNKPGIVRFVETVTYVDTVTSTVTAATATASAITTYTYTFTDRDVGMILNVTPQVNEATRCVTLFLQPQISNVESWSEPYYSSSADTTGYRKPNFYSKDIETYVTIRDGDTIVLGGFMEDVAGKTVYKVPFLSDIPLLGKLFQYKTKSTDKKKLLIFVTVNILDASGNSRITP